MPQFDAHRHRDGGGPQESSRRANLRAIQTTIECMFCFRVRGPQLAINIAAQDAAMEGLEATVKRRDAGRKWILTRVWLKGNQENPKLSQLGEFN
ncbi:MAG: hypothetical protein ACREQI_03000 [Candidatus Binataceae bacterium]